MDMMIEGLKWFPKFLKNEASVGRKHEICTKISPSSLETYFTNK